MNVVRPSSDFFTAPTTVDFIVPDSVAFREYIKDKPYIIPTVTLVGGYILFYTDEQNIAEGVQNFGSYVDYSYSTVLGLLGERALKAAGILRVQEQPFLNLRGSGVLVGIVDTGIDYTNSVFRYEDGTSKIAGIYDQTAMGTPPFDFVIGQEYTQEQINAALLSEDPLSIVPVDDPSGHGTFLASVAAGREEGDFLGAAPDAELLIVKLRKARPYYLKKYLIPSDQEYAFESSSVMLGIEYIVRKAQELGRPAAICIGLGTNLGGHDGFSLFEQYLDRVSILPGIALSVAGGNEVEARHHYSGTIEGTERPRTVEIRVGEDAGDIYLGIWNTAADRVSVSVTSPTGEVVERFPAVDLGRLETKLILEQATVIIEYYFPTRRLGSQNTVIKILDATPGIWTITLYGEIILEGQFHIWLPITGFVSPTVEFLVPDPYYTIVVPATALQPIDCGGYDDLTNSLYENSSWGPTRLNVLSPDLVAPAVNVVGVFPKTGFGVMTGTSVAAAITTGACALMLEWGIVEGRNLSMSTSQIRAYLIRGAVRFPDVVYPNNQWGYGILNLYDSFAALR